eukprot:TRINITY_DN14177_c0_g1_i3.p1 TRINITY_DN14177_c0_g1~~TRINITY_DN14177_c0_g1_i3.p1  ORF type:complete len:619 (-),score=104.64 TRINITY_DN14177_c0_g1_i3:91-1947(-)
MRRFRGHVARRALLFDMWQRPPFHWKCQLQQWSPVRGFFLRRCSATPAGFLFPQNRRGRVFEDLEVAHDCPGSHNSWYAIARALKVDEGGVTKLDVTVEEDSAKPTRLRRLQDVENATVEYHVTFEILAIGGTTLSLASDLMVKSTGVWRIFEETMTDFGLPPVPLSARFLVVPTAFDDEVAMTPDGHFVRSVHLPMATCYWQRGRWSDSSSSAAAGRPPSRCLSEFSATSGQDPTPEGYRCNGFGGSQCCFFGQSRLSCFQHCSLFGAAVVAFHDLANNNCVCRTGDTVVKPLLGPIGQWYHAAPANCSQGSGLARDVEVVPAAMSENTEGSTVADAFLILISIFLGLVCLVSTWVFLSLLRKLQGGRKDTLREDHKSVQFQRGNDIVEAHLPLGDPALLQPVGEVACATTTSSIEAVPARVLLDVPTEAPVTPVEEWPTLDTGNEEAAGWMARDDLSASMNTDHGDLSPPPTDSPAAHLLVTDRPPLEMHVVEMPEEQETDMPYFPAPMPQFAVEVGLVSPSSSRGGDACASDWSPYKAESEGSEVDCLIVPNEGPKIEPNTGEASELLVDPVPVTLPNDEDTLMGQTCSPVACFTSPTRLTVPPRAGDTTGRWAI